MEGNSQIICGNCGAENAVDHAFCSSCGTPLGRICPNCQTKNEPSNKFCFNCGTSLIEQPAEGPAPAPVGSGPVSDPGERRLVSVLFADLVGFTTFSEGRDPEDVRGMLTNFYERCREIIGRYGGKTDKFIGDAVMGVWGAVEAHEDDAERATRAALELVDMVAGLGDELGIDRLAARAGVLSGEASVGSGGNEQGLVVGDLVNTASRLQSIAEPGHVYVGASTRDLVGGAIEFRSVGEHKVKGKEIAVEAFEAVRVLALSTARTAEDALEGPFVGRADELRLLKDQLHATGRERRARMVSIIGEGGIGKSRLSAELIRYIDGLADDVYYHRGRSPSYGDGVTYWALGEMIRQRAGISEGEDPAKARMKLRTMVAGFAPSEEDQRWIEPRLASMIGLAESPPGDRAELFAALRAFFQEISRNGTVLMVFEDLHWGDDGLLDFIDELVERTTAHPILVLCLARPELLDRRPDWGVSRKKSLSMHLSRLDSEAMRELVAGIAPGLPETMVGRIADRTAGIPLHAVEFVRMLLNTGQLVRDGAEFRFEGDDEQLPIPDSVNAIIGARLDRLDPGVQSVLRDASVLGLAFSLSSIALLRQEPEDAVDPILRDLVRSEVLEYDENPRSPERGQYRFVQGLIREVAYGRLSRQERVNRHLAVAEMFEQLSDPELAGVVASHYAYAVEADPGNTDLIRRACASVIEAAERASSLKADTQAASLYERAAAMTTNEAERNDLLLNAAECLYRTGREDRGIDLARQVTAWAEANEDSETEMRAVTTLVNILSANFEAVEGAEIALALYSRVEKRFDRSWAELAQATSRALMLSDRPEEAIAAAGEGLEVMERLELTDTLLDTLINKGTAHCLNGELLEGAALLRGVADLAGERDLLGLRLRALNNLVSVSQYDNNINLDVNEELNVISERLGQESWIVRGNFFKAMIRLSQGLPDQAFEILASSAGSDMSEFWADNHELARLTGALLIEGPEAELVEAFDRVNGKYMDSDDPQLRDGVLAAKAQMLLDTGSPQAALDLVLSYDDLSANYPVGSGIGLYAATQLGDVGMVERLLDRLRASHPRGRASQGLAHVGRAYLLSLNGEVDAAEQAFLEGEDLWAKTQTPLNKAYARAVFAMVAGPQSELAVAKAAEARVFYEEAGYRMHLDGIMSRLPAGFEGADSSPADRPVASSG